MESETLNKELRSVRKDLSIKMMESLVLQDYDQATELRGLVMRIVKIENKR